jgi:hypothetical protein
MKKTSMFLSFVPMAYFALTSLGCMKSDSLGAAGNDDSGVGGSVGSGGATGAGGATAFPVGGNELVETGGVTALPMGGNELIETGGATATGGIGGPGGTGVGGAASAPNPVAWRTSTVSLTADDFWIVADGKRFTSKVAAVDVHSDPGWATYTTLEITWEELGREMRLCIYFRADPTGWWSDEIRTYNGQTTNSDWLYYTGTFFKSAIGAAYRGDVDLRNAADDPFQGELHLHGLVLSTTLSGGAGNPSLVDMLPADNEVSTWTRAGTPTLITDETGLYSRIDGGAPKYIDRGWVSSVYAEYRQGARAIQVAIHDMGSAANAQAIYNYALPVSRQAIDGRDNAVVDMGLISAYDALAYLDRFYIELNISEKSQAALTSIELFMNDILNRNSKGGPDAGNPSCTCDLWSSPCPAGEASCVVCSGSSSMCSQCPVPTNAQPACSTLGLHCAYDQTWCDCVSGDAGAPVWSCMFLIH